MDCVFLKLGGSLITEKIGEMAFREKVALRLGEEIRRGLAAKPIRLLLGHGAGSFGHFVATARETHKGLRGCGGWHGYAATRNIVSFLNNLLVTTWTQIELRPLVVAPSSIAVRNAAGQLDIDDRVILRLLDAGQVPMVFGDAVLDETQGFSIAATEDVFSALAPSLRPRRIILACDVDGVFTADPKVLPGAERIPVITAENAADALRGMTAGDGADVTGAMAGKVERLLRIARALPETEIRIISGRKRGAVTAALLGTYEGGTVVR